MIPLVKEYSQTFSLPQNKSRINNVPSKHQQLFLGNCYACNNFGHIDINCKQIVPIGKDITLESPFYKNNVTRSNPKGRNYNCFNPL